MTCDLTHHHYRVNGTLADAIDRVRCDVYEEAMHLGLSVTWDDVFEFRHESSVYVLANPVVGPAGRRNFSLQFDSSGYYLEESQCLYPQLLRRIDFAGPITVLAEAVPRQLAYDPWLDSSPGRGER